MVHRTALTRIEFLVGLITATLLIGCFLAAMFRLRTEADMMKCKNNLKQLVIGAANHHAVEGGLPSIADQGNKTPTGAGIVSIFGTLRLYLENGPVIYRPGESPASNYHAHSSVEFTFQWKDGFIGSQDGGVANQPWKVFVCSSDDSAEQLRDIPITLPDGITGYYATGSYAANGLLPWGVKRRGEFPGEFSNTILFGERPQVCVNADGETIYNLWGVGFYSPHMPAFATLTPTDPPGLWSTNHIAPALPLPEVEGPVPIRIGRVDAPTTEIGIALPIQRIRPGRPCDPRLPGTPHSRGMQVAMCDGSVRVFSTSTNAWVFWKACVPATG